MDQNNINSKFKKSPNLDSRSPTQREMMKIKIMDKFDVSPEVAERILDKIEKNERKIHKKQVIDKFSQKNSNITKHILSKKNNSDVNINQQDDDVNEFKSEIPLKNKRIIQKPINSHTKNNEEFTEINNYKFEERLNDQVFNEMPIKTNLNEESNQNVDSILGDIIPDYNKQVSITLNHVDLTFEVSNEKIDTIKETFIRTIKRNKSKKIKIHALKDVSFKIYKGEKVGIIGYNGAGKSTLLNVITGIYPPDAGEVTAVGNISPLLSLGAGFDYNFSGRKNIILNGAVLGYEKQFLESKIDEIIEFSELGELIDIPIKNYSSGMLAKLGFSIATAVNPDILIIDEILGVGDVNFAKKSRDKIKSLMDGGTTVLLVSHSILQIRELCDKAIWIDDGSIRAIGEVNKICDAYLKDAEKASHEQLANIQLD